MESISSSLAAKISFEDETNEDNEENVTENTEEENIAEQTHVQTSLTDEMK